jgi:hypothetical protein
MASHSEIHVGDSHWVIRVGGQDVRVKVLEKTKKASGRGYEFRVKRVGDDNRVFGRNLVRGSGALRRSGEEARPGPTAAPAAEKRKPPTKRRRPSAPAKNGRAKPVRASSFFKSESKPTSSSGHANPWDSSPSGLTSLRGRGAAPSSSSSTKKRPPGRAPRKPAEEYPSKLVEKLCKALKKSDGTERSIQRIYGEILAQHRMSSFGITFRPPRRY